MSEKLSQPTARTEAAHVEAWVHEIADKHGASTSGSGEISAGIGGFTGKMQGEVVLRDQEGGVRGGTAEVSGKNNEGAVVSASGKNNYVYSSTTYNSKEGTLIDYVRESDANPIAPDRAVVHRTAIDPETGEDVRHSHRFTEKNARRAGELVTSLAQKRIGSVKPSVTARIKRAIR